MPDHYDRAECATELRLRSGILDKIRGGWRHTKAFEVPPSMGMQRRDEERMVKENESTDSSVSSASETSLPENIADLYDFV